MQFSEVTKEIDAAEVVSKLQTFMKGKALNTYSASAKLAAKEHVHGRVKLLLRKTLDDYEIEILNGNIFVESISNVRWYDPLSTSKGLNTIFVDIFLEVFVDLATQCSSLSSLFLEILAVAACHLTPEKDHDPLAKICVAFDDIIMIDRSLSESDLFSRVDEMLIKELSRGLTSVPALASDKVFNVLSIMRVLEESRSRSTFVVVLRKVLAVVISKTWQSKEFLKRTNTGFIFHEKRLPVLDSAPLVYTTATDSNTHSSKQASSSSSSNGMNVNVNGNGNGNFGGNQMQMDVTSLQQRRREVTEIEVRSVNDTVMSMAPIFNNETETPPENEIRAVTNLSRSMNSKKNITERWLVHEYVAWNNLSVKDPQLTSKVMIRISSWFSSQTTSKLYQQHSALDISHLMKKNSSEVMVDVLKWATDATLVIFKDLECADIPLFMPLWTGVSTDDISKERKTKDYIKKTTVRFDALTVKFSVLKNYIILAAQGVESNIEILVELLISKIKNHFDFSSITSAADERCTFISKGPQFFSFFILLEFLFQIMSNSPINALGIEFIGRILRTFTGIALKLKDFFYNYHYIQKNRRENSDNSSVMEVSDILLKNIYAFVTLCSGIGYTFINRFSSAELITVLENSDWDVTNDVSSLFNSTTFPESLPDCSKVFIAHRAVLIVMKVYFMPHLGTQDCDKTQLKVLCDECKKSYVDPASDFSIMDMQKIFELLPGGKPVFCHYYLPLETSSFHKDNEEKKKSKLLPDLVSLGHRDFRRLANRLGSRYETGNRNGKQHNDLHISTDCMPLDVFSNDILIQVLLYLSFKRVCYMGYVSKRLLNASREEVLWEAIYKRKFPNLAFPNVMPYREKVDKIPECDECSSFSMSKAIGKIKKRKPCKYSRRKHSWYLLFQVLHFYNSSFLIFIYCLLLFRFTKC